MRCTATPFFVIVLLACTNDGVSPAGSEFSRQANVTASTLSALTAVSGQGAGFVKVTPTAHDVAGPGTFDVQGTVSVYGALPNTTFTVLRRVDLVPDAVCTGAAWLTLPPPNAPSFSTSEGGAGALHFQISRGAPFVDGVRFDVQWQLAGSDGSRLDSECFTVTVR
jgi:hypothetical protein